MFRVLPWCLIGCLLALPMPAVVADDAATGRVLFEQLCASCHGKLGEGTPERYPYALVGDRSVKELAEYIEQKMPEGEPEKCVGDEAQRVAAHMHHAFYSLAAQARLHPARVELSRLTVRQTTQSLADLVGSFRAPFAPDNRRGVRGEYFKTRRQRGNDRVMERVDPVIQFDFGEETPDNEKFEREEFSIRWQGGVIAPESGDYEFILRSENGARLWVNDNEKPLIDAWVKSGNEERRETIRLLGGRAYPLRLEFFKSKEAKEKRAAITLKWRPPRSVDEVVPERYLIPQSPPVTFVVQTPFPPDDRSSGYERGTAISQEWDAATTEAALETAGYVATRLGELAGARGEPDRTAKLKEFCYRFVERALRRPLSDEHKAQFLERMFEVNSNPDGAVKLVVIRTLKSPYFLYREAGDIPPAYQVASRLSFGLWDSIPDATLLEAAAAGRLASREDVVREAERMLADPRARAKLQEFLMFWLKTDHLAEVAKDREQYPEFDTAVAADLRTSLNLFLDEVVWGASSDYRQLLLADELFLNGRLARFYGADVPENSPFQKMKLADEPRAGVLTHPYLLSAFAYTATSSPIHRGVFLSRSILGRSLRPPPVAVAPLAPDLHADLTTRERILLQTKPEACQSCHGMINPLGFTLENFDAVGRFRKQEAGKEIDASGTYRNRQGDWVHFQGVRDLANYLAQSEESHRSFAEQLFHHLVKQPIQAYGLETSEQIRHKFAEQNFQIRRLMVEIMVVAAFPPAEQTGAHR